ncbi:MAG: RnfABCDGE type electron transport complex subunit D [Epulopiscium sp.]|nr:RnfABCDGE type electron transport complex subunit D [Candidatus Epulonipiscium sp.]
MSTEMYTVSSSPHIHSKDSIQSIMRDVFIALLPAALVGVWVFKFQALIVILLSVASCVGAEALWQKLTHQKISVNDYSAAVTGLLLAMNLPPTVPFWLPIVGGAFAIIIAKQLFGGLGQNFINPALAARAFLLASWPVQMTTWTIDGVTTATPLGILKEGGEALPSITDLILGNVGGCIGETSAIALLIGGLYLIYKKVISIRIPATFIGTVLILTWILGRGGMFYPYAIYEIFTGGLFLGAFFMATDYSSSPVTVKGQYIMGLGCGILTTVIRLYGGYPEGVSYSILIMNLAVPLIDRYTQPRIFGEVK